MAHQISELPSQILETKQSHNAGPLAAASSGPLSSKQRRPLFIIVSVFAVTVAIAVRWYGLAEHSLWIDEGYSVWLSRFSPRGIWRLVQADTSPPVYYWFLHFWTRLFGTSEVSLRGMSAFFATLSIPLFMLVAKRVLQDKALLLVLWLYAFCVFQVHYAKDARFYSLLSFCSIASLYFLIVFLDRRSFLSFAGLVVALVAGLYIHNMMFFYLPGLALAWLLYPSTLSLGRRVRDGLLCGALVLLIYLPWLPVLAMQTKAVASSFWVPKPTLWRLVETLCSLSGLDFSYFYRMLSLPARDRWVFMLALVLPLVFCVVAAFWKVTAVGRRKAAALLCYALCPVLLAFFYSLLGSTSVFLERTFIASSAALLLLLACSVTHQTGVRKRLSGALAIMVLLGSAISLIGFFKYYQTEDWRGMTEYLIGLPQQKRLIVSATMVGQVLFDYYSARDRKMHPPESSSAKFGLEEPMVSRPKSYSDQAVLASLQQAVESGNFEEIDVIPSHAPPQLGLLLQKYLMENCGSLTERTFNDVTAVRCISPRGSF